MSTLSLRLVAPPDFDVDMSSVTPDALKGRLASELRPLRLRHGQRGIALGALFESGGAPDSGVIEIAGSCARLQHLGAGMTGGELRITGDCGTWLGREMRGGRIALRGNAGDGVGARMRGGLIDVTGSVGDFAGGAKHPKEHKLVQSRQVQQEKQSTASHCEHEHKPGQVLARLPVSGQSRRRVQQHDNRTLEEVGQGFYNAHGGQSGLRVCQSRHR